MNRKNITFLSVLLFLFLIQSCWKSKGKNIPDVSNIKVDVEIKDFNQAFFSIDTNDIRGGISQLQQSFPSFFDLYFINLVPLRQKPELDDAFFDEVRSFLTNADIRRLADTTAIVFPNLDIYKKDFEQAFQFYKHYFPNRTVPKLYTFITGFNYANLIFQINESQDGLGVGLDMLLGNEYPYSRLGIQNPAFSTYITRAWTPEHLVKTTLEPLVEDLIQAAPGDRLLDLMIHNGKKLFIMDRLLPHTPDSIKWKYTATQTTWVKENEFQLWQHLLVEELLYETSMNKIKKLVDQSPSSPGMPKEAPGRTGNFMGLQIVKSYMNRNKDVSLEELIITNPQKIFDKSNYKPRRRK